MSDLSRHFIVSTNPGPCIVCAAPTNYVEIDFECYVHPDDCHDRLIDDYFEALSR